MSNPPLARVVGRSKFTYQSLPMWKAHGVVGHPLHLKKSEPATLLRLMEAVMAPGWMHRDGRVTPAGLIADRTGRGAATDRLALLLLVLEARETGRARRCGGTVDTRRGRAAATVARLLGCTASAAERVLERLEGRDLVRRVRVRMRPGSRTARGWWFRQWPPCTAVPVSTTGGRTVQQPWSRCSQTPTVRQGLVRGQSRRQKRRSVVLLWRMRLV